MKRTKPVVQYEPKWEKSFDVIFPENSDLHPWMVLTCDKPKYVDGKWQHISIKFNDFVGPSTSRALYEFLIPKPKKPFIIKLVQNDPTREPIEEWEITVKSISIDFGKLDYESDKKQEVVLIIEPKTCVLK